MVYKLFDKETSGSDIEMENMSDKQLAEELHRWIRKFKKRKVQSPFINNIWVAYLPDMQSISKFNRGYRFFIMCNWHSKYAWVIPLKDKKGITTTIAFPKIFKKSNKNQTKYGLIRAVNFIIAQWNRG